MAAESSGRSEGGGKKGAGLTKQIVVVRLMKQGI
jgi:hypothetical protein